MAFDETYNEPESTEVLVKSLDPEHPAQLHYAHAGDAGADLITTVDVTLKPFERVTWRWCTRVRGWRPSRASPCSTRPAPSMPDIVARSKCR